MSIKEQDGVDRQWWLIDKGAATTAQLSNTQGLRYVCTVKGGAVYADKGYWTAMPRQAVAWQSIIWRQ